MEIEMALALLPRFGGRLGDALVGLGMLRPVQLFRAIADQVRERLLESFRWRRGQYAFVPGVRSHEETFPLGHDPFELLRDAALQTHPDELEPALAPIHELILEPTPDPPATLSHFRLPDPWTRLIQQVDGRGTVGSILARETSTAGGADAETVYRALFFGLSCRFVRTAP
jgi:serine/threonine-protein kinase